MKPPRDISEGTMPNQYWERGDGYLTRKAPRISGWMRQKKV